MRVGSRQQMQPWDRLLYPVSNDTYDRSNGRLRDHWVDPDDAYERKTCIIRVYKECNE